jgi:hypothetical protein
MPQVRPNATFIPPEGSILCENCGYTLDGLPDDGNCPECGYPVAKSRIDDGRTLPAWEDVSRGRPRLRFLATTAAIIFRPATFYRSLQTRRDNATALLFAQAHWLLSAVLFGLALTIHMQWYFRYLILGVRVNSIAIFVASVIVIYALAYGTTYLAAWLTAWEAAYRGIRLPKPVVLRGLYYHSAHYLPVGLLAVATTGAFAILCAYRPQFWLPQASRYLLILCVEVLLGAGYLFKTYWTGMRGMMYANR